MNLLNALTNAALSVACIILALCAIPPGVVAAILIFLARSAKERMHP